MSKHASAGLHRLFPRPRAVALGDDVYEASELRVRDVAKLEGLLQDECGDPLEDLPDADDPNRRKRLRKVLESCRDLLPRIDNNAGREALATIGGAAIYLSVVLGPRHPELDMDDFAELSTSMTKNEWRRLDDIAWNVDPMDTVVKLATEEGGDDKEPANWDKLAVYCSREFGWTFDQFGDLTMSQLDLVLRDGESPHAVEFSDMTEVMAYHDAQRKIWYDDDEIAPKPEIETP